MFNRAIVRSTYCSVCSSSCFLPKISMTPAQVYQWRLPPFGNGIYHFDGCYPVPVDGKKLAATTCRKRIPSHLASNLRQSSISRFDWLIDLLPLSHDREYWGRTQRLDRESPHPDGIVFRSLLISDILMFIGGHKMGIRLGRSSCLMDGM